MSENEVKRDNPFNYVDMHIADKESFMNTVTYYCIDDVENICKKISSNEDVANLMSALMHYMLRINPADELNANAIYVTASMEHGKVKKTDEYSALHYCFEWFRNREWVGVRKEDKYPIGVINYDKFNQLSQERKLEVIEEMRNDLWNFIIEDEKENEEETPKEITLLEHDQLSNVTLLKVKTTKHTEYVTTFHTEYVVTLHYNKETNTWFEGKYFDDEKSARYYAELQKEVRKNG